jgi:hypothetical protein
MKQPPVSAITASGTGSARTGVTVVEVTRVVAASGVAVEVVSSAPEDPSAPQDAITNEKMRMIRPTVLFILL